MPIPLALPAAVSLGSKLFSGFFKGRGEKKKAEALNKAAEERQTARMAGHDVDERRRREKLNAVQGLLQRVGGSLPQGAPDYTYDPEVLQKMQELRPFTETVGDQRLALGGRSGGDATAGSGSAMLAGFAGGLGDAADTAILGSAGGGGAPMNITPSNFDPGMVPSTATAGPDPEIDWDEILRGF